MSVLSKPSYATTSQFPSVRDVADVLQEPAAGRLLYLLEPVQTAFATTTQRNSRSASSKARPKN